jgi:hypothetical protein
VVVDKINTAFVAPIDNTITSFPRTVLDQAKGSIVVPFLPPPASRSLRARRPRTRPRPPTSSSRRRAWNQCSDLHVLPHADRSKRPASDKTTLINYVNNGGRLYQACHSVSDLDVNVTHFLSTGLILYESHSNGMPPYNDNPTT